MKTTEEEILSAMLDLNDDAARDLLVTLDGNDRQNLREAALALANLITVVNSSPELFAPAQQDE